jgi:hypothetical protein
MNPAPANPRRTVEDVLIQLSLTIDCAVWHACATIAPNRLHSVDIVDRKEAGIVKVNRLFQEPVSR